MSFNAGFIVENDDIASVNGCFQFSDYLKYWVLEIILSGFALASPPMGS